MKKRWSFPIYEQRLPEMQKKIMTEPEYNFLLIFDGDIWIGELLCWETEDFIYVEHFCALPEMRGRGYGAQTLSLLGERKKTVILEIDPPNNEVSVRRKAFMSAPGTEPIRSSISTRRITANIRVTGSLS